MTVVRVKKTNNFVTLYKACLQDTNISLKAKGFWAYCMGQPDDWTFHVTQLASVLKEGEDAIYSAIKELIENGYCKRIQNNINGKFQTVDYEISEIPEELKKRLPHRGFPDAEVPDAEDPGLLSIDTLPNIEEEEVVCPSGAVAPSESQKKVEKIGTDGNKRILEKDAVIRKMIHQMPEVTMGEIEEAWKILVGYAGAVNDPMQFILGTVKNLKSKSNIEKLQAKDKKCPTTPQMPPVKVLTPEEIASRQQHAQTLFSEYLTKP